MGSVGAHHDEIVIGPAARERDGGRLPSVGAAGAGCEDGESNESDDSHRPEA